MRLAAWASEIVAYVIVIGGALYGGMWISFKYAERIHPHDKTGPEPPVAALRVTVVWIVSTVALMILLGEIFTA
jgi:hypothetical protein